ncbi:MAG: nucleoside diphosphate kinase regulator [Candidatus Saccharimonadales bacterium]
MAAIVITKFDHERLTKLLGLKRPHDEFDRALLAELAKAKIVEPAQVPPDVITMNSKVRFKNEQGEALTYWLVFPEDADISNHKMSILSPIGCALIGYKVGDTITLHTPNGSRKLMVEEILHQPEREGDFQS